jgi:hypothetical protein
VTHEDLIERVMAQMPESWDGDEAAESLVVEFVETVTARARAAGVSLERHVDVTRPMVIALVGSTKFRPDFDRVTSELTMDGHIVINPGVWWSEAEGTFASPVQAAAVKECLDELHLRKIDLADMVMVINLNGYVGESTAREIEYAKAHGKRVAYAYAVGTDDPLPGFDANGCASC